MKKILFLSSALVMTVCGAFAEDVAPTTDKKITGGAGRCSVDVLGVSADGATANTIATWSLNSYDCAAGQYLDETTLLCTECPTGSYCHGGTFTVEANNSKTACPADYTSDAAATAESECYMGCELACSANMECPPHSNNCTHSEFKTTGKQYVDATCNAYPSVCPVADFGCDTGYTKTQISKKEIMENFVNADRAIVLACDFDNTDLTNGTHDYLNMSSYDNSINDCEYLNPGSVLIMGVAHDIPLGGFIYELSLNDYTIDSPGVVKAYSDMDIEVFILPNANMLSVDTGTYLWERISKIMVPTPIIMLLLDMSWTEKFSSEEEIMKFLQQNMKPESFAALAQGNMDLALVLEMDWVSTDSPWYTTNWIYRYYYFNQESYLLDLSFVLNKSMEYYGVSERAWYCANNIININWNSDNGGASTQNMCMYDGPVILPPDPVKPGYTFTGWKLLEETTTE